MKFDIYVKNVKFNGQIFKIHKKKKKKKYEKFEEFMERNFVQSLLVKYCLNASLFVICVLFKVIQLSKERGEFWQQRYRNCEKK